MNILRENVLSGIVRSAHGRLAGGQEFDFLILSRTVVPELEFFSGSIGDVVFVSESVRPEFREFVLVYELELMGLNGSRPEYCVEALRHELELVPSCARTEYLQFRYCFFEELIATFQTFALSEKLAEWHECLKYLRRSVWEES